MHYVLEYINEVENESWLNETQVACRVNVQALRITSTFVYTNHGHLPIKQLSRFRQEGYVELHLFANFKIDEIVVNPEWGHE